MVTQCPNLDIQYNQYDKHEHQYNVVLHIVLLYYMLN